MLRGAMATTSFRVFPDVLPGRRRRLVPRSPARLSASSQRLHTNTDALVNAGEETQAKEEGSCRRTLTDAVVHLIAVFLQVVLDAALEEVQLRLELLGDAEHVVLTPGQVGVVPQEAQPERGGETAPLNHHNHKRIPKQNHHQAENKGGSVSPFWTREEQHKHGFR